MHDENENAKAELLQLWCEEMYQTLDSLSREHSVEGRSLRQTIRSSSPAVVRKLAQMCKDYPGVSGDRARYLLRAYGFDPLENTALLSDEAIIQRWEQRDHRPVG